MLDLRVSYVFGLTMLITYVVGGIAAGRWLANRKQATYLWTALTMWAMGPVLAWVGAQYTMRAMGLQGDPLGLMALLFLVPDPVFVLWCLAAYFGARYADLGWRGKSALWICCVAGLLVTGHGFYSVFFPTLHSYGFIRE
jgi:hypothetical protein